jgi:omega-amidase
MPKMFRLAVCSIALKGCIENTFDAITEAGDRGADLILVPEEPDIVAGWEPGLHALQEHPVFIGCQERAKDASLAVVGSISARLPAADTAIANMGFVLDRQGELVGTYRKKHPAPSEEYIDTSPDVDPVTGEPDAFPVFDFEGTKFGICICMDVHFPEQFRIYMLKGADMVLLPTMYMDYTGDMLESVEKARAADNQMYIALSRYVDMPYLAGKNMGYAKVIAPDARVIVSTGHQPGVAIAEFDPKWRMPFWGEGYEDMRQIYENTRRPDLYGEIVRSEGEA